MLRMGCIEMDMIRLKQIDNIYYKGITPGLFLCGIVTNVSFLLLYCSLKKFNPILKVMVLNLAIADILHLSTHMFEGCWKSILGVDQLGAWKWTNNTERAIRLAYGLLIMLRSAALYTMIFLLLIGSFESFNRLVPHKNSCASFMRTVLKQKNVYKFVLLLWLVSFCLGGITSIPQMTTFKHCLSWFDENGFQKEREFIFIIMREKSDITPQLFRALQHVQFWIILIICINLIIKIFFKLSAKEDIAMNPALESDVADEPTVTSQLNVPNADIQQSRSFQSYMQLQSMLPYIRSEGYSHRVVYALVISFLLLKGPAHFIILINIISVTISGDMLFNHPYFLTVLIILSLISSVINPLLYIAVNADIRQTCKRFCCCSDKEELEEDESTMISSPTVKDKTKQTSTFTSSTV